MNNKYFLRLDQFEGPLDLLLYLIKANELDIFSIDLFTLTNQYLDFLRFVKFKDLEESAGFIDMAASLIEIKSRKLLPHQKETKEGEDPEEDPEELLRKRIYFYEQFKHAGQYFQGLSGGVFATYGSGEGDELIKELDDEEAPIKGDKSTLLILYEQMLAGLSERKPATVTAKKEGLPVEEIINQLKQRLEKIRYVLFQELYKKFADRYELVAHILAFLQLVRDSELYILQDEQMGPIWLYQKDIEISQLPINIVH